MSKKKEAALIALADFLAGPSVAQHSMGLALPAGRLDRANEEAKEFFALRASFNVSGWATRDEAEVAIRKVLE